MEIVGIKELRYNSIDVREPVDTYTNFNQINIGLYKMKERRRERCEEVNG